MSEAHQVLTKKEGDDQVEELLSLECKEIRQKIEDIERKLDRYWFKEFMHERLADRCDHLVNERQAKIIHEKLIEMKNEKQLCEMMLESL